MSKTKYDVYYTYASFIQIDIAQSKQPTIALEKQIKDIEIRYEKLKSGIKKIAEWRKELTRKNELLGNFYQSQDII